MDACFQPLWLVTDSRFSVFEASKMIACYKLVDDINILYIYFRSIRVLEKVRLPSMSELHLILGTSTLVGPIVSSTPQTSLSKDPMDWKAQTPSFNSDMEGLRS